MLTAPPVISEFRADRTSGSGWSYPCRLPEVENCRDLMYRRWSSSANKAALVRPPQLPVLALELGDGRASSLVTPGRCPSSISAC
jgi:hypothetical protein